MSAAAPLGPIPLAALAALLLLAAGILLAFLRLVRGPQPADRIVALDLISVLVVAFLGAYSIYAGEPSYLDVAIACALVAFLGTVALARYLERSWGARPRPEPDQPEETP